MPSPYPSARARIGGVPVYAMLAPFPLVCFVGALLSDITYANSADMQWTNFSAWLLAFGTFFMGLTLLFGLIDLTHARLRAIATARWLSVGNIVVFVLALFNDFVHSRDAWTSVVPQGLILSIVTALIVAITSWMGASLVYRHGVGVVA